MFTRMRQAGTAVLLSITLLVAPACGVRMAPCLNPSLTPAQQAHQIEVSRLREIQRGADITKRVGELMVSLSKTEIAFHAAGRIPTNTHHAIQGYFEFAAEGVLEALDVAKDATQPIETRMSALERGLRIVGGLRTKVIDRLPEGDVKLTLGLALATAEALLFTWNVGS
jgi:hypothetical protein